MILINKIDEWVKEFTGIYKEDKWLYFELIEQKPKTKVFQVMSKCSNFRLGLIKWYPQWRHYCFFPTMEEETVYSDRCLISISEFVTQLNLKHKEVAGSKAEGDDGIPPKSKDIGYPA